MLPSLRLALYVGLGGCLWAVSTGVPEFRVVALLYDAVLVLLAFLDVLLSPQPAQFELERQVSERMNLGTPNAVALRVRSRADAGTGRPVLMTVRDEPPYTWPVAVPTKVPGAAPTGLPAVPTTGLPTVARLHFSLAARQEAEGHYYVTPTRRGDFRFGALSARYPTALGFWYRQFRRQAERTVRVYPDSSEVRRFELRLREGRLRDIGLHLIRLRGRGTEFESLRDYTSDDEYKDINWKATARRGKLIATNYEIERDQTMVIAIDCGRMMTAMAITRGRPAGAVEAASGEVASGSSPVALSKLDCAINATVLLAHVGVRMGDSVGLLLFSDRILGFVPPRKGRTQTGAIIEALYASQPALVEPDYSSAYEYLLARKVRRALVVTFTDLIDPIASRELLTATGALRRHHNPLCVTINNRDVMDLASLLPESADQLYTKAMAQRMLSQRNSALEELRQRGVGILNVPAEQLTVATVNRYLDLKSRGAM